MQPWMAGVPALLSSASAQAIVIDAPAPERHRRVGKPVARWQSRDVLLMGRSWRDRVHSYCNGTPDLPAGEYSRVLSIPQISRAIRPARGWVREALASWALDALAEPCVQIASELVSNALSHARGESRLTLLLMYAAGTLRVEVRDEDRVNLPVKKDPVESDIAGRGLIIVEALSERWGVRVTDLGKSVWAELDFRPRRTAECDRSMEGYVGSEL